MDGEPQPPRVALHGRVEARLRAVVPAVEGRPRGCAHRLCCEHATKARRTLSALTATWDSGPGDCFGESARGLLLPCPRRLRGPDRMAELTTPEPAANGWASSWGSPARRR